MFAWIIMLFSCLLTPAVLMGFGSVLKDCAPRDINALFGYRTGMSMKNRDTWEFANTLWGRLAWKWGNVDADRLRRSPAGGVFCQRGRGLARRQRGLLCADRRTADHDPCRGTGSEKEFR